LATSQRWAEGVAAAELANHKDPQYRVKALTYTNPTLAGTDGYNIMYYPIGHMMYLTDYQSGVTDVPHVITGKQISLAADKSFSLTWSVRPLTLYNYDFWDNGNWDSALWGI
jgi:hypothetical protein